MANPLRNPRTYARLEECFWQCMGVVLAGMAVFGILCFVFLATIGAIEVLPLLWKR